jgi:hypothetical protein
MKLLDVKKESCPFVDTYGGLTIRKNAILNAKRSS